MYPTEKVDMAEYFRAELSHLTSVMIRTNTQDIQNRCLKCGIGKFSLSYPFHSKIFKIVYSSYNTEHVFSRALLTIKWYLISKGGGG